MKKKYLKRVGIAVLIIVLVGGAYILFAPEGGGNELLVSEGSDALDRDITGLISTLENVRLEGGLLDSPLLENLIDFRVELAPQPVGRTNPFAPIGADANFSGTEIDISSVIDEGVNEESTATSSEATE